MFEQMHHVFAGSDVPREAGRKWHGLVWEIHKPMIGRHIGGDSVSSSVGDPLAGCDSGVSLGRLHRSGRSDKANR